MCHYVSTSIFYNPVLHTYIHHISIIHPCIFRETSTKNSSPTPNRPTPATPSGRRPLGVVVLRPLKVQRVIPTSMRGGMASPESDGWMVGWPTGLFENPEQNKERKIDLDWKGKNYLTNPHFVEILFVLCEFFRYNNVTSPLPRQELFGCRPHECLCLWSN